MGSVTTPLIPIVQVFMLGFASVYVRVVCQHELKFSWWANKSWLAPSKSYTIPRLEFMFAVV